MWHTLAFVAESRRLDAESLAAFAMKDPDKYGIVVEDHGPEVNTWHVDHLVQDYRKAIDLSPVKATLNEVFSGAGNQEAAPRARYVTLDREGYPDYQVVKGTDGVYRFCYPDPRAGQPVPATVTVVEQVLVDGKWERRSQDAIR